MSADFWAIITVGIAILIAIGTSNRSLRREMSERITGVQRELGERIDRLGKRIDTLGERLGDVRERLGRVEGLLEGFGLTRRKRAGQERDDEKHGPALPRS